jgi:hypothetical protein
MAAASEGCSCCLKSTSSCFSGSLQHPCGYVSAGFGFGFLVSAEPSYTRITTAFGQVNCTITVMAVGICRDIRGRHQGLEADAINVLAALT